MTMKFEMHLHTYFSIDGLITPRELENKMKEKKINYACLTDHNVYNSWDKFKHLNVIQGVEKTIKEENGNLFHLLIYFMNEPIKSDNFDEVIDSVREQDAFCSIAHPFDTPRAAPSNLDLYYRKVDALEILNPRARLNNANENALKYAETHKLARTAGSDAHHCSEIGNTYVECECFDLEEFRNKLKLGQIEIKGKKWVWPWVRIFSVGKKRGWFKPNL